MTAPQTYGWIWNDAAGAGGAWVPKTLAPGQAGGTNSPGGGVPMPTTGRPTDPSQIWQGSGTSQPATPSPNQNYFGTGDYFTGFSPIKTGLEQPTPTIGPSTGVINITGPGQVSVTPPKQGPGAAPVSSPTFNPTPAPAPTQPPPQIPTQGQPWRSYDPDRPQVLSGAVMSGPNPGTPLGNQGSAIWPAMPMNPVTPPSSPSPQAVTGPSPVVPGRPGAITPPASAMSHRAAGFGGNRPGRRGF